MFPLSDLAVQNVSMALRAHPRFEVVKNLPEIGWRAMKQYFQVKDAEEVIKCEKVLAWMSPGPDAIQDQRTLISLQKSLTQMQVIIFNFFYKAYFFSIKCIHFLASINYAFGFDPFTTSWMSNCQKIISFWIAQGLLT